MKKLFVVLSLLAVLAFGAVPSQALVGVPDDSPGRDILVPFFYVSMPGYGNENTLITITEVKGRIGNLDLNPYATAHMELYDRLSIVRFNKNFRWTKYDVVVTDAYSLIQQMNPTDRDFLRIDADGDGIFDHWAGYMIFWNTTQDPATGLFLDSNQFISQCYQVYLTAGMAVGFNGVKIEYGPVADARQGIAYNYPHLDVAPVRSEAYSANALWIGWNLLRGLGVPVADATWFRLLPRYFVLDSVGKSLLVLWYDSKDTRRTPAGGGDPAYPQDYIPAPIHCNFWDEEEHVLSANIYIPYELNIIDIRRILPGGLFAGYPWGGWIDITLPDPFNQGWDYGPATGTPPTKNGAKRQWIGYSWQRAIGPAQEAWEVIHPMDRDAGSGTLKAKDAF